MKPKVRSCGAAKQRGFSMIEILVTLLITAFGLLGLAGFTTRATALSIDATQRARAAAMLNDMAGRIENNKANAAAYVSAAVQGAAVQDCTAVAAGPLRDLCEWCVTQPIALNPVYVITVTWGSLTPGIPSADLCAKDAFGDESLRRAIRSQVRVANLTAP